MRTVAVSAGNPVIRQQLDVKTIPRCVDGVSGMRPGNCQRGICFLVSRNCDALGLAARLRGFAVGTAQPLRRTTWSRVRNTIFLQLLSSAGNSNRPGDALGRGGGSFLSSVSAEPAGARSRRPSRSSGERRRRQSGRLTLVGQLTAADQLPAVLLRSCSRSAAGVGGGGITRSQAARMACGCPGRPAERHWRTIRSPPSAASL